MEALRREGIEFILFHHETAAGFAAGVAGQLTGLPGVCLSTIGPGAVNMVAAAAAATLERSPMLAITAEIDAGRRPRVRHMKLDLERLFAGVVKGSTFLQPESAAEDLAGAWNLALTPPTGAVHLALSPESAATVVLDEPGIVTPPIFSSPDADRLELALRRLSQAGEIVILAGVGIEAAGAQDELLRCAEAWQVPVAVTPKAKGHFSESHPLYAGCYSAYGDGPLRKIMESAELILGLGLDSVDFIRSDWDVDTPVVNFNLAGADDPALGPELAVDGDLKESLAYIADHGSQFGGSREEIHGQVVRLRAKTAGLLADPTYSPTDGCVPIVELVGALRRALPENGAVTVDVGVFKLVFLQLWSTNSPKSLFVANGLSAMGYALPGALAVALERPERKVVAVTGDGALLMYAGELATLAREGLPIAVLVVVDDALSLIRLKQVRQGVPPYGTEFQVLDYRLMARSFGLEYRLIDGSQEPEKVIEEALSLDRPVLIEARIDPSEYDRFR